MAKFEPGHAPLPGCGRPKGTKSLIRAVQVMAEAERHPITELIALADNSQDRTFKRDIWLELMKYVEIPQREPPSPLIPGTPEESVQNAAAIAAELARLSQPLEPEPSAKP